MPTGWKPMSFQPPYRAMLVGCGTDAWLNASEAERAEVFLPRFIQVLKDWEELGARPLCSFVDDVFKSGKTPEPFWSWYLIFEIDDLETGARMVQASRQSIDGVRIDKWVRLELRIGRAFYSREEDRPCACRRSRDDPIPAGRGAR